MKTHILYYAGREKKYFSGVYTGDRDEEGFAIIDFKWSTTKNDATLLTTPDAWDLLGMCRYNWPHLTLEIERIVQLKELIYAL